ncbi:hypothetical protein K503DRAFT_782011 [Rhizopogon vinicolor AM-OR11-026]|uniref:Uncharacterized protein n=1 Tax=Rhizopogon vinicolor AM-OR11-026 TaxID=1314800 RepID=A0A1B7N424_9AGAM|nr:hypothetical protein K503DRAFT_782011 [Rhizopogon vinicolor AM-OR11-026]
MTSLASLHSELSAGPNYMGLTNVLNNAMWQRDTCGRITVEKSSRKEFVAVIKQPIPKHTVYLSDIENPEGAQKGKVEPLAVSYTNTHGSIGNSPVMDAETDNWPIAQNKRWMTGVSRS